VGLIKEFKEFAARGNVIDMAVGVIIGGAFGKIVSVFVADVIMPPIGKALGNVNFADLFYSLDPEKTKGITTLAKAKEAGAAVIAYGSFINAIIDFTIVAFCIFLMVKAINTLKKQFEEPAVAAAPTTKDCPRCIMPIPLKATRCGHCTSEL
jgi:large conductance mechanosensitive channel